MSDSGDGVGLLRETLAANRRGEQSGVAAICSAEPHVLRAAVAAHGDLLCIESTASQVNQFGGYTGMDPMAFAATVRAVAATVPPGQLVLGGDHLGPYPWRGLPAAEAMARAAGLVRACVLAGYGKLHLDASMSCADDPGGPDSPLDDEVATARTVDLCRAAEAARGDRAPGASAPVYVIGTEVPVPGGEKAGGAGPRITSPAALRRTLDLARAAFAGEGLDDAWERVVAVVAQPGVEFGDDSVTDYQPDAADGLVEALRHEGALVFEAHSTDYQRPEALARMVRDGFAILKVGPQLTFALREAVFALESIEKDWLGDRAGVDLSSLRAALEQAMLADPADWAPYYRGAAADLRRRRAFSYSDRCRYYWGRPGVHAARDRLLRNLATGEIPATLISQYLPQEYAAVRAGTLAPEPHALVEAHVTRVLEVYRAACGG